MHHLTRDLAGTPAGSRFGLCRFALSGLLIGLALAVGAAVVGAVVVLPACQSSVMGSCSGDQDCPPGETCQNAVCVPIDGGGSRDSGGGQGDTGGRRDAGPPPGCPAGNPEGAPCGPGSPICLCSGSPPPVPGTVASCHRLAAVCDGVKYGACADYADPECTGVKVGGEQINPGKENSEGVIKGSDGTVELDPKQSRIMRGFAWIANTGDNTITKLDTDTGHEVARYSCVLDVAAASKPVPYNGNKNDCLNCPSRTAIDANGDAYVANRAHLPEPGRQGTVTKFANDVRDCVDRNLNGKIDTSTDVNDDGVIDLTNPLEFLGYADECILWTVPVGGSGGNPRAIAVDKGDLGNPSGNVWVGLFNESRAVLLSGSGGQMLGEVELRDGSLATQPYGATVDSKGDVWFTSYVEPEPGAPASTLARVDSATRRLKRIYAVNSPTGCHNTYGIQVDVKDRIWLGTYQCGSALRFSPDEGADGTFAALQFDPTVRGVGHTRGITPDLDGTVWVAMDAEAGGHVARFDAETLSLSSVQMFRLPSWDPAHYPDVVATIGVGIDRNGDCWAVSRNDDYPYGQATRIRTDDANYGKMDSFRVGKNPYTYSDFTGFGLATVTRPTGWFSAVVQGCADNRPSRWKILTWTETEPPGTKVQVEVRTAAAVAELASAAWFGPWDSPPQDLAAQKVPEGRYLEVRALLSSTQRGITPKFGGYEVTFDCKGEP